MNTPMQQVASLAIGTVEFVSPSEIRVLLDLEAPQATALNTGVPTGFPRINGYVLVPNETGAIVGLVTWLGVEHSQFPKRTGLKDFGLVDLPFPLRKLSLVPVGTLIRSGVADSTHFKLQRGVSAFPSVGDQVLLPTAIQLKSIVESAEQEDQRVQIGTSPLASNAKVTVDPNKLFGRHLAVLGNTGSGKSCSVAGLIRWSIESAKRSLSAKTECVNARFIVLDPNGEYAPAFNDLPDVRVFRLPPLNSPQLALNVPAWLWNSHEWSAFAHAAPGLQRPLLLQALRELRSGTRTAEPLERRVRRVFGHFETTLRSRIVQSLYTGFPNNANCGNLLQNIATDSQTYVTLTTGAIQRTLQTLSNRSTTTASGRRWPNGNGYNDFSESELNGILTCLESVLSNLPQAPRNAIVSEDAPKRFAVEELGEHLDSLAREAGGGQAVQFIATLRMRIDMMLADARLGAVINPAQGEELSFVQWLELYIGKSGASNGQIAILDLSLVPSDVLHTVIAVIARIIFEATQRYRRLCGLELPSVLVLEEAHNFIRRGGIEEDGFISPSRMCRETFERIAREGRKFGLGLLLSSQRPSELSATVLAQCNTFLLHRLVNDEDQKLVSSLLPDNLGGLLRELPSLPSRLAILLGWATPVPVLVEMTELTLDQRPKSSDPKFWEVWTGQEARTINWNSIAEEWTQSDPSPQMPGAFSGELSATTSEDGASYSKTANAEDDDVPF